MSDVRFPETGNLMGNERSTRLMIRRLGRRTEFTFIVGEKVVATEIFASNRIVFREGVIPDGRVVEYYREGNVKKISDYSSGKPEGLSRVYYPTGELWEEQCFRGGKLDGPWLMYRRDGTRWSESFYRSGKQQGVFRSYHDNGQLEVVGFYEKGRLHGDYECYDKFGCLKEKGSFEKGKKMGTWTTYSESGEVAAIHSYDQERLLTGSEHLGRNFKKTRSSLHPASRSFRRTEIAGVNAHKFTKKGDLVTSKEAFMTTRDIFITQYDLERLQNLIEAMSERDTGGKPYIEKLEEELERAHVLEADRIPSDVITMNSKVRLKDLDSGEELIYSIVFPGNADTRENAISVLAPIGTALLGYRENDTIEWQVPSGTRRFKVLEVMYQPERSGHHRL